MSLLEPEPHRKWNENHKICISEKILSFYEKRQLTDVTLVAKMDDFKIQAHRMVLSSSSDYFLTMFSSDLKEANPHIASEEIILKDIDGPTLKTIIDFTYSAPIELTEDNIENLITAADFFQMQTLKDTCCEFIKEQIELDNCLGIVSFAEQYNLTDLYKTSTRFITANFIEVSKVEEFLQLDAKLLFKLLSNDNLRVKTEEDVFRSLVAWMQYDEINREDFTESLLSAIRFSLLSPAFISDNAESIRRTPKGEDIICSWLRWHSLPHENNCHKPRYGKRKIANLIPWNGHFYLQMFDIIDKSWSCVELPPPPKMVHSFTPIVIDNKLILVGGKFDLVETKLGPINITMYGSNIVQCFDLIKRKWSYMPRMLKPRYDPAVVELDGELIVMGGFLNDEPLLSTEKYNFKTGKWHSLARLVMNFEYCMQIEKLQGKLYISFGSNCCIYCYDPDLNKWLQIDCHHEEYFFPNLIAAGDFLYLVGGLNAEEYIKLVYRYDPKSKNWSSVASLPYPRSSIQCFALNDGFIACGGRNNKGEYYFIDEYNPLRDEWKIFSGFRSPQPKYQSCEHIKTNRLSPRSVFLC